jgi:3-hydroxymyristoyl/3-hydroxydecanoyl-(acyl carrier protein) dehydratase
MIDTETVFKNIYPESGARPHTVSWTVDTDLPYFNGHFPQTPILPAIAIVDASTYVLQRALNQPDLTVKVVVSAKFLSPIVPAQKVRIEIRDQGGQQWLVEWKEDVPAHARLLATLSVQI